MGEVFLDKFYSNSKLCRDCKHFKIEVFEDHRLYGKCSKTGEDVTDAERCSTNTFKLVCRKIRMTKLSDDVRESAPIDFSEDVSIIGVEDYESFILIRYFEPVFPFEELSPEEKMARMKKRKDKLR